MKKKWKRGAIALVAIVFGFISVFVVAPKMTKVDVYEKSIEELDESKQDVLQIMTVSAATSVALSLLPGDACTPIAEKFADLSKYFLLILCGIYLEKCILILSSYASF